MRRVPRFVLSIALVLWLLSTAAATAAAFDGPRLSYVREGEPLQGEELLLGDPWAQVFSRLVRIPDGGMDMATSWSGDGSRIAVGTSDPISGLTFPRQPGVFVLPATGGQRKWIRGTQRGFEPVFSPDGET